MKLPQHPQIQEAYAQLLLEDRMVFEHAYALRSKGIGASYLAWMVGSHYVYLGRQKVQFAYWFTAGGLLLWALADLFRIPGMVNAFNTTVALNALKPFERHSESTLETAIMLESTPVSTVKPARAERVLLEPSQPEPVLRKPVPGSQHAVIELVFQ
jgi:hypothetical protein